MYGSHAFLMLLCVVVYVHTVVGGIFFLFPCNCCIKVFVRNMFVSEDELNFFFFLTAVVISPSWSSDWGVLPFSVLCVRVSLQYIFFLPWGILPFGASCDPDGTKVCMLPTNLQPSSKPKTTLSVCVWLAGTLAGANSALSVKSTPVLDVICTWHSCLNAD